jgi:hypothetical protein
MSANRFLVKHPDIPSYLISEATVEHHLFYQSNKEVTLRLNVLLAEDFEKEANMLSLMRARPLVDEISVSLINHAGLPTDTVRIVNCALVDIFTRLDWHDDSPVSVKLKYSGKLADN